jgi:hypothetical protein
VEHVLGADCPSTRDTSIQIFDKFVLSKSVEYAGIMRDTRFLSHSAAVSVVLGAKFTDGNSQLTMVRARAAYSLLFAVIDRIFLVQCNGVVPRLSFTTLVST